MRVKRRPWRRSLRVQARPQPEQVRAGMHVAVVDHQPAGHVGMVVLHLQVEYEFAFAIF